MSSPQSTPATGGRLRLILALALAALAMGLFARTTNYDFVNYDDYDYVVRNKVVQEGLSPAGYELAIKGGHSTNWHPLTTLSHLLDVEWYGIEQRGAAGGHHRTNVLLHGLNAALCFLALFALTRRLWVAALVAALFALHPQRVESVAWISERKDLLSGTFFFLTLLAWTSFARSGGALRYLLAVLALALGLLSKQMLVSLPFLLVLLDMGPLGRWVGNSKAEGSKSLPALLLEKLPLIALAAGSIVPMWLAQSGGGTLGNLPLLARLENAFASCFRYIHQMLWPLDLAPFYPHPSLVPGDPWNSLHLPAMLGAALVIGLSYVAFKRLRTQPLLATGWFWYLGMLVPVIGLVQVGSQSHADRYTYLPSIGLYLLIALAAAGIAKRKPKLSRPLQGFCVLCLGVLFSITWNQVPHWKNSRTLNRHTLAVTENNYVAHNNYGLYLMEESSDPVLAAEHFQKALAIRSNFVQAAENLAASYIQQQRVKDATLLYRSILREDPSNARVLAQMASLSATKGDLQATFDFLEKSTQSNPNNAGTWVQLGLVHLQRDEGIFAEQCASKALQLEPNNTQAHILNSRAARMLGYPEASVSRIQAAVDSDPSNVEAYLTQCRIYADQRQLVEAERVCETLLEIAPHNVQAMILRGKFLMLRYQAAVMESRASGSQSNADLGLLAQAKTQVENALQEAAKNPEALEFYGLVLMEEQQLEAAEEHFKQALEVRPDFPSTLSNLGGLYQNQGREAEALEQYRRLMETASESANARSVARAMAWILATSPTQEIRDGDEAVRMGNFAMRSYRALNQNEAHTFEALAAAFALVGRFDDAVKHQEVAVKLARSEGLRKAYTNRLALYQAGKPYQRASK